MCKGFSSFGAFFNVNGEIDVLVHLQECSWSRVDHPDQVVEIGQKMDLKIISIDESKLQIGCSIKKLTPDPFENVDKYEINKDYDIKIVKIMDFGAFGELEKNLICLLHNSELGFEKSLSAKKMLKVGNTIKVRLIDIDQDKRRIAVSHKQTLENPYQAFADKFPVGTVCEGVVVNKNEYALFLKIKDTEVKTFCHCTDLTYLNDPEEELKIYKPGDTLNVKVMEIKVPEQRVRVSHKSTLADPFDYFKEKSVNQIITAKIIKTDNKGLLVRPENCELDFHIKKSNIALNVSDQRQSRFSNGDKIDVGIQSLQFAERKVVLSIKLVEEMAKKEALEKYGHTDSGKQLPFKSLKEDLLKGKKEKK